VPAGAPHLSPEQILYGHLPIENDSLTFEQRQRLAQYLKDLRRDRDDYSRGYKIILETISDVLTDKQLLTGVYLDDSPESLKLYHRLDAQAAKTDAKKAESKPNGNWPGRTNPGWLRGACALEAWQRQLINFEQLEESSDLRRS
jgi:hypothetical protein